MLTLLDFALATFTSPEQGKKDDQPQIEAPAEEKPAEPQQQDKIRIKVELRRIAVILNNDGIRLATLSLTSAQVERLHCRQ